MPAALRFDLIDLRLFLHVVEAGSITAGCGRSHLSLASASARLRGMEHALGLTLLERGRSGVKPTKAGLAVAHHARLVMQQLERLRGELGDCAAGLVGTVRVLANTAAVTDYLPQALAGFLNSHPGVDVDLQERPSHRIVAQLLEGMADIGIVADSVDVSSLETVPFRDDRLVLVTARGHVLGRRRRVAFAETLGLDFIGLDDDSALQQHLSLQAERLSRRMRSRIRLRSFDAVCRMVEAGVGVAIVPAVAAARCATSMRLRVVALADPWAERRLLVCARRFADLSPSAAKLVGALRAAAREN